MDRSLWIKIASIVGVTLVCLYGIIGIPKNQKELVDNFNKNIKLGLDLKGGSQLVLQVQVQDAFKAEADQLIDRLKTELKTASIDYASFDRNEPGTIEDADKIEIVGKGIPVAKTGDFRRLVNERFPVVASFLPTRAIMLKGRQRRGRRECPARTGTRVSAGACRSNARCACRRHQA